MHIQNELGALSSIIWGSYFDRSSFSTSISLSGSWVVPGEIYNSDEINFF